MPDRRSASPPLDITAWLVPAVTSIIIAVRVVPECFSSQPFHTWDLHGHIALTRRLAEQLLQGRLLFYDHAWFTGWPAFSYYPPLGHFLAALLTLVLRLFSSDPARLSCQLLIGISLAGLPLSMFAAAKSLFRTREANDTRSILFLLGCSASLFACFFISHQEFFFGLGSRAGTHLGLLSQVIGWHCLLFYLNSLFRQLQQSEIREPANLRLTLSFAALLLTHTLTFLFVAGFSVLLLLSKRAEPRVWLSHVAGIGLSSWWLLPAVADGRVFAPLDQLSAEGDFFSLLLQTTPGDALRSLLPRFVDEYFVMPFFVLVTIAFVLHRKAREHPLLLLGLVMTVLAQSIFVSDFFAKNFPFSLHLYRFLGLAVLLFVTLLAIVPAVIVTSRREAVLFALLLLGIETHELLVLKKIQPAEAQGPILQDESNLLEHLKTTRPAEIDIAQSRVLFELPTTPKDPDFRSPHFLPAALNNVAGRESGNGLFIQSSLSQVFLTATAAQLKLDFYGTPELDSVDESFTTLDFIAQLRTLGISTVVSMKSPAESALASALASRPQQFGKFFVYELGPGEPPLRGPKKYLLGYIDRVGSLPFKLVEYVFYSQKSLWTDADLIALDPARPAPQEVDLILINDGDPEDFRAVAAALNSGFSGEAPRVANLKFLRPPEDFSKGPKERLNNLLNHSRRYLISQLNLPAKLAQLPEGQPTVMDRVQPGLSIDWLSQRIRLSGLTPGRLVRLNYSFAPGWRSAQGHCIRGSEERLWFLPESSSAELQYRPFRTSKFYLGAMCTLAAAVLTVVLARSNKHR